MKIHILGICGTFMGGIAAIAREMGYEVSGSDQGVYPPMSDTLQALGIELCEGYDPQHLQPHPDLVIVGNALSRGNPAVEYVLNQQIPYVSGPEWLATAVLQHRHVLAVAGTHGKTSTSSMLTWILEHAGYNPGYLIGGVAKNFTTTARLGERYFVIEADEYDTAFFDKRSKFLHYQSRTLILNNLEFDHADIFANLEAIKLQFQYLLRTVAGQGLIIHNATEPHLTDVLERGCWSRQQTFADAKGWHAKPLSLPCHHFEVYFQDQLKGQVQWSMIGRHNMCNALAAIAAAQDVGVDVTTACEALSQFGGIKRRLEVRGVVNGVTVYDDFAHHPTAISETVGALRQAVGKARIIAVLQFGSNTMKRGEHLSQIAPALAQADEVVLLDADDFDCTVICDELGDTASHYPSVKEIVNHLQRTARSQDHVLIMSNKGFGGIHQQLLNALATHDDPSHIL